MKPNVGRVTIWVTLNEWSAFKRLARKRGRSASQYLRHIIKRELREPTLHSIEALR